MISESCNDFCSWFKQSKYALMAEPLCEDCKAQLICINCRDTSAVYLQKNNNGWNISKFTSRHLDVDKKCPNPAVSARVSDVTMSLEATESLSVRMHDTWFFHFLYDWLGIPKIGTWCFIFCSVQTVSIIFCTACCYLISWEALVTWIPRKQAGTQWLFLRQQ